MPSNQETEKDFVNSRINEILDRNPIEEDEGRPWPIVPTIILFFLLQPMRAIAIGTIVTVVAWLVGKI
jgi:hypothetical protein